MLQRFEKCAEGQIAFSFSLCLSSVLFFSVSLYLSFCLSLCRCASLISSCLIKAFLYQLILSAVLRIFLLLSVMLQIFLSFTFNWQRKWTWSRPVDSNIKICHDLCNYKNVKSLLDCSSTERTVADKCFRHLG